MNVLVTGGSGFLGQRILKELRSEHCCWDLSRGLGADFSCDLSKEIPDLKNVHDLDMVVHCAGKAHVKGNSPEAVEAFYQVNTRGTENLLKGLEKCTPKTFVFISTVAVYGLQSGHAITEEHPTKPDTPYGKSKLEAEILLRDWASEANVKLHIWRLPLISGSKPPGNLNSMKRAISAGWYLRLGNGNAQKSMVGSSDVAQLLLALDNKPTGTYNLTDGLHPMIKEVDSRIARLCGKKVKSLPQAFIDLIAFMTRLLPFIKSLNLIISKLSNTLTFSDRLARQKLSWNPKPALNDLDFKEN